MNIPIKDLMKTGDGQSNDHKTDTVTTDHGTGDGGGDDGGKTESNRNDDGVKPYVHATLCTSMLTVLHNTIMHPKHI